MDAFCTLMIYVAGGIGLVLGYGVGATLVFFAYGKRRKP